MSNREAHLNALLERERQLAAAKRREAENRMFLDGMRELGCGNTKSPVSKDNDDKFVKLMQEFYELAMSNPKSAGAFSLPVKEKPFRTEAPIQIAEDYYYQGVDFWHNHNVFPPYPGSDGKITYDVCNMCSAKSPKEVTDKLKFILNSMKGD